MGLRAVGNQSLAGLKSNLRRLPITVAQSIAVKAAPALTGLATEAYDGNRNVYGDARPIGVDGAPLTLERTGTTRRTLKFTSTGTLVRCVLGTRYARYLIGNYQILPNGAMPAGWTAKLNEIVRAEGPPL